VSKRFRGKYYLCILELFLIISSDDMGSFNFLKEYSWYNSFTSWILKTFTKHIKKEQKNVKKDENSN